MALKEITDHILRDAQAKADKIKEEAEERSRFIIEEAAKQAKAEKERIRAEVEKQGEEEKKRTIATARLQARNDILAAKQNKTEEVFDQALRSLAGLPEFEYMELMKKMLKKAAKGGEEVIVNARDRKRLTPQFLAEINPSLRLSPETREISGGFFLRSGRIETNSSLEALIYAIRGEVEPEVHKALLAS